MRRIPRLMLTGLALACCLHIPALASDKLTVDLEAEKEAILGFQVLDQTLQDIGWKLVRGNAEFCPDKVQSLGLQLQDVASYGRPDIARAALGLVGDFAIQTAAAGSPAGSHPAFWRNREVIAVDYIAPNSFEVGERYDWRRLKRAHDAIDTLTENAAQVTVQFADGEEAIIAPVAACATRFELAGEEVRAVADGERVVIGVRFRGFDYTEGLFAAAIAHELAHNLLAHRAWLDANGRSRRNVRDTEREADRLMPWLLANAGYDPAIGARFFATYKPKSGGLLFIPGSHDSWEKRARTVGGELAAVRASMRHDGKVDWAANFEREIDPQSRN